MQELINNITLRRHARLAIQLSVLNLIVLIIAVASEIYLRPQIDLSLVNMKLVRYGLLVTPLGCVSGIVIGWTFHVLAAVEEKSSTVGFFSGRHLHSFSVLGFIVPPLTPMVLVCNGLIAHAMRW